MKNHVPKEDTRVKYDFSEKNTICSSYLLSELFEFLLRILFYQDHFMFINHFPVCFQDVRIHTRGKGFSAKAHRMDSRSRTGVDI